MPTLLKRSNGIYYIVFRDKGRPRWKSTHQRLKPLAIKALIDFKSNLQRDVSKATLSQFQKEFLAYAASTYSRRTVEVYRHALAKLQTITGDIWLTSIIPKHVDQYKIERLKSIAPVSVNVELRTLKAAFYTALRWGLLTENPFKKVSLLRLPYEQPAYFTKEEFRRLLSLVGEQWLRELVIVAVSTGLRRGELLNLTWQDVDFERWLLHVHSTENFRTKGGRRRAVPMSETLFHLLWNKAQHSNCQYVFTLSGRKVSEDWISHKFKFYLRKAGLSEKLHFHSLRHTFATWLVQEGVSIYEVQKLLGHSSISVTQIYSHLAASELHGAVNKISLPLN